MLNEACRMKTTRRRWQWVGWWTMFVSPLFAAAGSGGRPAPGTIEAEVWGNVLSQPVGPGRAEHLALPDAFVARVVDRIICDAYFARFRLVVGDGGAPAISRQQGVGGGSASSISAVADWIALRAAAPRPNLEPAKFSDYEIPPPLRGFWASALLSDATGREPLWRAPDSGVEARVAAMVATELAGRGLLATTLKAIVMLGEAAFLDGARDRDAAAQLERVGIPVDLLAAFDSDAAAGDRATRSARVIRKLAETARARPSAEALERMLAEWSFSFVPLRAGFRAALEDGAGRLAMLRLQMPRADHWIGPEDGGAVDLLKQLAAAAGGARFSVTVSSEVARPLALNLSTLKPAADAQVEITPLAHAPAQWAQDNGKGGWMTAPEDATERLATLVPRYASRSEATSVFTPGESDAAAAGGGTDHRVLQSSLIFQAGNLLVVRAPRGSGRMLLIGEAEIYRNVALGLSANQALAAFRAEFGVDECVVLQAVGFHIDLELSVRRVGARSIAFVNGVGAGTTLVLQCGLQPLTAAGVITDAEAATVAAALVGGRGMNALNVLVPALQGAAIGPGQWPLALAERFSTGPSDSGVANFQRFLFALDYQMNLALDPANVAGDAFTQAYVRAFHRRAADRAALHATLREIGFEVLEVPGFSEGRVGLCAVNAIQDQTRCFYSAVGGVYSAVDEAARAAIVSATGNSVEVIAIRSGESQSRVGGVHCSAGAYYSPVKE